MNDKNLRFSTSVVAWPLAAVVAIWVVFWAEIRFSLHLNELGIFPRTLEGLRGVVFSPFLHGDISHLYNNTIPIFLLIAALRFFYRNQALKVIVFGILISGFLTWLIGRSNYHIGASGLIYVLASFIFFKGIQTKYYRLVAVSFLIILIYGGMIWYVFPDVEEGISWEGHLSGFVTGYVFSLLMKTPEYQKTPIYDWEKPTYKKDQDEFMQQFDEQGNFSPWRKIEEEVFEDNYFSLNPNYRYIIVPKPEDEIVEDEVDRRN